MSHPKRGQEKKGERALSSGKKVQSIFLIAVLALSFLAITNQLSSVQAESQSSTSSTTAATTNSTGTISRNGTLELPRGNFGNVPIQINTTSYLVYETQSDVPISTAVMNAGQFQAFSQGQNNISDAASDQNGTSNLNALLLTNGTYYLAFFAFQGAAKISYFYSVISNITVQNATTYVGAYLTIPPFSDLAQIVHLQTLGSPNVMELFGVSNQSIAYSLYDNTTHMETFASPGSETVTNMSLTSAGNLSLGYNVTLSRGLYTLFLTNNKSTPAFVYFDYQLLPAYVNPYLISLEHPLPPAPTGIGAFGIYNNSGKITPYTAEGSSVIGYANISSMMAVNPNDTTDGRANLQMNAVLQVKNGDNSSFVYWPQNVMWFATNASAAGRQVLYRNNVFNMTGDHAILTNDSIHGTGFVSGDPTLGYYYGNYNSTYLYGYQFPLEFVLYINETVQSGHGVWLYTGVQLLRNGSSSVGNSGTVWFDKIFIVDPNVTSANFVVTGSQYTPTGSNTLLGAFYDTELVFGGDLGGRSANFTSLRADLSLFYYNQSVKSYPSVYAFGADTAEAAYNLQAAYHGQAVALSTKDRPAYELLTNNFSSSLPALVSGNVTQQNTVFSQTGSNSSASSSSTTSRTSSSSSSSSNASTSTPPEVVGTAGAGPALISSIQLVAIAVIILILLGLAGIFALSRRSHSRPAAAEETGPSWASRVPMTIFCRNCGSPNLSTNTFCANCGTRLPTRSNG